MPADFRQYINLRPLDISPAQLYLDAVEVARTVFPNFDLRPGTIEDAMFQAFAYMSALNVGAINRLPDSLMLGIGKMIGTQYVDGQRATLNVTFTANSNNGATVPIGTVVTWSTPAVEGEAPITYAFETVEQLTIASNSPGNALPTGTVECSARDIGIMPVIQNGQSMAIASFSQSIYSAVAAGNFVQGSDADTVDEYLDRTVATIGSFSSAITTTSQASAFLSSLHPDTVKRVKAYDLTDKDGDLIIGDADVAGHVTLFVYGPERNLTNDEKTLYTSQIVSRSVAGLDIGIKNPVLLNFKITATINYLSNLDVTEVSKEIKQNLLTNFSPLNSQWSEEKLRLNDVLRSLYSNPSVHSVDSLAISKTDSSGSSITNAVIASGNVTYTANNTYSVGDQVIVSGITPNTLNSAATSRTITARTDTSFTVSAAGLSGAYTSGGTSFATSPNWGNVSGNDILYYYKGSLLNLQPEKIVLTLNSIEI